jgi:hypothetical protein
MSLGYRNLFQNKVRLLLSAAGVALSVMLILVLNGFLSGVDGRPLPIWKTLMWSWTIRPLIRQAAGGAKC